MHRICVVVVLIVVAACSSAPPKQTLTLAPPATAIPVAAALVTEGNQHFESQAWEKAKASYEAALKAQKTLAEAHYNLALTFERTGDAASAKTHYLEAASLAPGNKTIWNAPPLRKHMTSDPLLEKNRGFLDGRPQFNY